MRALLVAVAATAASAALPPPPPFEPNTLAGVVDSLRRFAPAYSVTSTGLRRASLLATIAGITDWFLPFQDAAGSIIDPDSHEEEEYATPCFAHAASTLVVHGARADLLPAASAALNSSIRQLSSHICATASCDFFAVPVMRSFAMLTPLVSPATAAGWVAGLKNISLATWELPGQNWELTALAGEYTRIVKLGYAANTDLNWTFWESRIGLLASRHFWSAEGLFLDNIMSRGTVTSPMAYDAFGSSYPAVLLSDGYAATGAYADFLAETQERGVWSRAAYQSPLGEQPVGGRSNQHQFAEATLAAVAELYAGKARDAGDAAGACQLKRAAALYHRSIRRWVRPDGAIQITKNWFLNHTERFGYMSYSFFSNYNLLPASWLSLAYEFADDSIAECAAPADVGGLAFSLDDPAMRKVYASALGTYVELQTGADPNFDASGLNRLHIDACDLASAPTPCRLSSLLGPSQAPGIEGNFAAERTGAGAGAGANVTGGLSTGLVWRLATDAPDAPRRSLANQTLATITAVSTTVAPTNSPLGVAFTVTYVLWAEGALLTEQYALAAGGVNVTASLSLPGPAALFAHMAAAAAAAAADADASASGARARARSAFFSPPADARAAAALAAGDLRAFLAASPPPPPRGAALASVGISFAAMRFDGLTNYSVALDAGGVVVQPPAAPPAGEGGLRFSVAAPAGRNLTWTYDPSAPLRPSRNGLLAAVYAELVPESASPTLSYSLALEPWAARNRPP